MTDQPPNINATPVVDDAEMLRAYAETIGLKDAQIERLKSFLIQSADALEKYTSYPIGMVMSVTLRESGKSLIAELRNEHNQLIKSQITQAHQDYEAFISDPNHRGFNAEAYWMGARGLFDPWLAQIQAEYAAQKAKPEPTP